MHHHTRDYKDISAAILVGGLGTRLQSVVSDRPKAMATIAGKPFLFYLLSQLHQAGIRHAVLCTGHKADAIKEQWGNHFQNMTLTYSHETKPLGTGGALRQAIDPLQSQTILVCNGDSYCHTDLQALLLFHLFNRANATMLLTQVPDTSRFGQVLTNRLGEVTHYKEKQANAGSGWINAGYYLLQREMMTPLAHHQTLSLEKDIFPRWIGRGMFASKLGKRFVDIGTPASYAQAQTFFADIQTQWQNDINPPAKAA